MSRYDAISRYKLLRYYGYNSTVMLSDSVRNDHDDRASHYR